MAARSIRAFHECVTYTTQTFEQHRGLSLARLMTVVLVATMVAGVAAGAVMLSPLSKNARALTFHSSVVDRGSLVTLAPGSMASVTLRFRNSGFTAWERGVAGAHVALGVKNDSVEFARAGLAVGWTSDNRIATPAEPIVPPGAVATFTFMVRAPALGVYRIPVQLVADDVTWLEDQDVFVVVASDFGFHGELVDQSRHPTLRVGETSAPITVKLRNTGARTWVRGIVGEQVNLGLTGEDRSLSALGVGWPSADRVAIQNEPRVEPGDVATFAFRVRAPATPGTYPLRLRPVVDGVTWLEDAGVMSLITVTAASGQQAPQTAQTASTTFASSASVAPASVSAGNAASITAALASSTATTALVGVEVYTPDGATLAFQTWFDPQTFAPGESRSYPVTWQVPASAAVGTYTVLLRAFAPGWTKQLSSEEVATFAVSAPIAAAPSATAAPAATSAVVSAGTTGADPAPAANANGNKKTPAPTAPPSFSTSATAAPSTVNPNGAVSVNASFTSATATTVGLIVAIYAEGGALPVHQQSFNGQGFGAGQQRSYPLAWSVPSDASLGTYRVGLGVYTTDWATEHKWTESAATFAVAAPAPSPTAVPTTAPAPTPTAIGATPTPTAVPTAAPTPTLPTFTQSASVNPATVTAGGIVTITASFTSAVATTAIVSIYVFAPDGLTQLNQQYFENQVFAAGQTRTYTVSWPVPTSAAPGAYVLKLGTFPPGWSGRHYSWTDPAGTFTVAAPAATPAPTPTPVPATPVPTAAVPTFTQSATVSPTTVNAGGIVTITASFTSATAVTAITSVYVYAPGGVTELNQQYFENQVFSAGQTRTYTVTWPVPSTAAAGVYVIKLGTFPAGWSGRHYSWTDPAGSFTVTAQAATPVPPTPSPTAQPTSAPQLLSVNDTGFTYAGTWRTSTGSAKYQGDDHHSDVSGSTFSITFTGTSLALYSSRAPYHGIAAVSVDGGPESDVDLYDATRVDQALVFTTTTLANATHTVRVRVTGRKNPASSESIVNADRVDIAGSLIAPTPTPVPTAAPTPAPTTAPTFSGLRVAGNRLVNAQGQTVVLRGVNRMGLEYMCVQAGGLADGPVDQASVNGMRTWRNSNAVRVPLNEQCWLGVGGTPRGATYQQGVENYVNLLTASGMYVILDLHWSAPAGQLATGQQAMPNTSYSAEFWRSVASRFKGNPMVLFDLFNEPIPNNNANDSTDSAAMRSWSCWRDGGASGNCDSTLSLSVGTSMSGSQVVGMQALVDAVRSTGAQNVIVLGGIQWANTIWSNSSRNLWAYRPNDPLGQLVASLHSYDGTWCPDTACFDREVTPIAANMPVIFGEFGNANGATVLSALMRWADAHGVGYLAWTWAVSSSGFSQYKLIQSWDGTPNDFGQVVKGHLALLP
jgi:endoglucanase